MFVKRLIQLALFGMVTFSLGCSTTREIMNFDTVAEIQIKATETVNPDSDGRPSPLVLRIFKMSDSRQFEREDFLALYEGAEERLGNDLLGTIQLKEIAPGEKRMEAIELTPEIKYLGVIAEYSRYGEAKTMLVLPIEAHYSNDYTLIASDKGLAFTK